MSGVRRAPSAMPVLSSSGRELLPTSPVLWQEEQVPLIAALPVTSLRPVTPVMVNWRVLKSACPRATDCCAAVGTTGGGGGIPGRGGGPDCAGRGSQLS